MKFFSKKLLGHEIFELYSPLGYKIFFEKLVKPCGLPSYKLNVHSRISRYQENDMEQKFPAHSHLQNLIVSQQSLLPWNNLEE